MNKRIKIYKSYRMIFENHGSPAPSPSPAPFCSQHTCRWARAMHAWARHFAPKYRPIDFWFSLNLKFLPQNKNSRE